MSASEKSVLSEESLELAMTFPRLEAMRSGGRPCKGKYSIVHFSNDY